MNNTIRVLIAAAFCLLVISPATAEKYLYGGKKTSYALKGTTAGCSPSSAFEWLDINNVRARINAGGDMFWDLPGGTGAKYYVPKAGSATSMFSGSLWIGGLDINNQLKMAAQRFRQDGIDFWTGPLTTDNTAAIDNTVCAEYDRQWKITRAEVDEFLTFVDPVTGAFIPAEGYVIPKSILEWPAHGDVSKNQSFYLAPFYDIDADGEYNPLAGDYPYYDIDNSLCNTKIPTMDEELEGSVYGSVLADQVIKGDQTIWWVFNDKGNFHTETQGAAIGMEIRAQAFAFATNDEVNNMTFYSYEIINRSTFELTQTYFSLWVDPDVGFGFDDFTGCDVGRGLGYVYNGKAVDGNGEPESYGNQPPAIGVDFFQGPYMDPDGLDNPKYDENGVQLCDMSINGVNFGNDIVDDERFGMRRFIYHNNSNSALGDPDDAAEHYNLLTGKWKGGEEMHYGGNGFPGGPGTVGPRADFMFPGDSDPCNWGTGGIPPNGGYNQNGLYWTEENANNGSPNTFGDRRFMQSAGPFTLKPGAVNYITVGIPWARAVSGGAWASVELLRVVDDKCQALFDNCFKVIDGPSAPDLSFRELDREIIVYISNSPSSNNFNEEYAEFDPNIIQPHPLDENLRSDSIYYFEGYQIFQLRNATVSVESLNDPDKARIVAQFDKKNGVSKLVNFYYDESIGSNVPRVEVTGGDNGIRHSFSLTQDAFATDDVRLINHKQYYFIAIAYAYNEYMPYSQEPGVLLGLFGQKTPYLAGRKNIGDRRNKGNAYVAIPHKTINGIAPQAIYGEGPEITRLAGNGNGGMNLELKKEVIEEILSKEPASATNRYGDPGYPIAYNPTYEKGRGPINVKVIDPLNVVDSDYELYMDEFKSVRFFNVTGDPVVRGDTASKQSAQWYLKDLKTGEVIKGDTTILANEEQLFIDKGISIQIFQPYYPGRYNIGKDADEPPSNTLYSILAENNGFIESSITYADSSRVWLDGLRDEDIPGSALNWIRSGTYKDQEEAKFNDWGMLTGENPPPSKPWDPNEAYEKIALGTWAPHSLVTFGNNVVSLEDAQSKVGPAFSFISKDYSRFENISSVDIVLTPDKSKWTRSPVLEMQIDSALSEGNAPRFGLRRSASVNKDGTPASAMDLETSDNPNDPNYIASYGMGWFPGYAINVETGERLNIMFGEDSYLSAQNGRDMLFNPPSKDLSLPNQALDPNIFSQVNGNPLMGGQHYVYIMSHDFFEFSLGGYTFKHLSPAYDAGRYAHSVLDTIFPAVITNNTESIISFFFTQIMYVGMPMGIKGQEWLSNDVTIRIRVAKPYQPYYSTLPLDTVHPGMDLNDFRPAYAFSTKGIATEFRDTEKLQTDLDLVNVVPNPYYAYSEYEKNALDNRIKITNLPEKCVVTIYNMSGTKIRQFKKDEEKTSIDWDLKNFAGVPISSGVYLIHVKSEDGERILKWFGTIRPIDLNTF